LKTGQTSQVRSWKPMSCSALRRPDSSLHAHLSQCVAHARELGLPEPSSFQKEPWQHDRCNPAFVFLDAF